jgi:hypothetical protein
MLYHSTIISWTIVNLVSNLNPESRLTGSSDQLPAIAVLVRVTVKPTPPINIVSKAVNLHGRTFHSPRLHVHGVPDPMLLYSPPMGSRFSQKSDHEAIVI